MATKKNSVIVYDYRLDLYSERNVKAYYLYQEGDLMFLEGLYEL